MLYVKLAFLLSFLMISLSFVYTFLSRFIYMFMMVFFWSYMYCLNFMKMVFIFFIMFIMFMLWKEALNSRIFFIISHFERFIGKFVWLLVLYVLLVWAGRFIQNIVMIM